MNAVRIGLGGASVMTVVGCGRPAQPFSYERSQQKHTFGRLRPGAMNGILTAWVITWRIVWPAIIGGAVLLVLASVRPRGLKLPPLSAFAMILLPGLALVIWGGGNWAEEQGMRDAGWRSIVHAALALLSVAAILVAGIRHRKAPNAWTLGLAALAAIIFVAGAWFVGAMAIGDSWL